MRPFVSRAAVMLGLLTACKNDCRGSGERPPTSKSASTGRSWKTSPFEPADGGLVARKLPRALYRGGPFLRNPRIATVTFRADDPGIVARVEQFGDTIARSAWWRTVVDSYCAKPDDCIGEGSSGQHVRLDDVVPADVRDTDVDEILERAAQSGRIDVTGRDTLVLVYLPAGVALRDAYVSRYCAGGPRAFHRSLTIGQRKVAYAILPRCGDEAELTATASHELLEASANPDPGARGFAFESGSTYLGFTAAGLEPVDPCGLITRDKHRTTESGFVVQRAWSNREASLGHDPCVPSRPDEAYFALVPERPTVRLQREGESVTIPLEAVADRPVPAWTVSAVDVTGEQDHVSYVDLVLDKSTVAAGDTASLTITLRKKNAKQLDIVGLVSTQAAVVHMWPVAVVVR